MEAARVAEEKRKQKEFEERPKPPLFERYHQAELALPQHHVADPFANGKKYLWVENHVHGESPPYDVYETVPCLGHVYNTRRLYPKDPYTYSLDVA